MLTQPGALLLHHGAEVAAVEYEECPSIHTSRVDDFEYTIRVLPVHLFRPDLNRNALSTQIKYSENGQGGYWNAAEDSNFNNIYVVNIEQHLMPCTRAVLHLTAPCPRYAPDSSNADRSIKMEIHGRGHYLPFALSKPEYAVTKERQSLLRPSIQCRSCRLPQSPSLFISLSLSLAVSQSLSSSVSLSPFHSHSFSLHLHLYRALSISLSLSISLALSTSAQLSCSLSRALSLSLYSALSLSPQYQN